MAAFSTYLAPEILDHVLINSNWSPVSTIYCALFVSTANITQIRASNFTDEVSNSGTAYARTAVTFGTASGQTSANSVACTFPQATASWLTVGFVAIVDTNTYASGNVYFAAALNTNRLVDSGSVFKFDVGDLTVTLT